jgi:general secretion pathway protein M
MTERFTLWWRGRSPREQRLLLVMGVLLALVLGWLLVVRPLDGALDAAKQRHGAAVLAAAEARAEADVRRRAAQRPRQAPPLLIDGLISQTATEAGFTGARIAAQGPGRASVAIDAARPQAFFAWIAGLEQRGLVVQSLRAQANPDRTLSTEAVLRARGR